MLFFKTINTNSSFLSGLKQVQSFDTFVIPSNVSEEVEQRGLETFLRPDDRRPSTSSVKQNAPLCATEFFIFFGKSASWQWEWTCPVTTNDCAGSVFSAPLTVCVWILTISFGVWLLLQCPFEAILYRWEFERPSPERNRFLLRRFLPSGKGIVANGLLKWNSLYGKGFDKTWVCPGYVMLVGLSKKYFRLLLAS